MKKSLMTISSRVLMVSMLSMSLWVPNAQAGLVSSEQLISSQTSQLERERIRTVLDRQDVREQLQARGIDADAARAAMRVEADCVGIIA